MEIRGSYLTYYTHHISDEVLDDIGNTLRSVLPDHLDANGLVTWALAMEQLSTELRQQAFILGGSERAIAKRNVLMREGAIVDR